MKRHKSRKGAIFFVLALIIIVLAGLTLCSRRDAPTLDSRGSIDNATVSERDLAKPGTYRITGTVVSQNEARDGFPEHILICDAPGCARPVALFTEKSGDFSAGETYVFLVEKTAVLYDTRAPPIPHIQILDWQALQ